MLPVIMLQSEEEKRNVLFAALEESAKATNSSFDMLLLTESAQEAARFLKAEEGIVLLIADVEPMHENPKPNGLQLGLLAMRENRDHYVVYCLSSSNDLEAFIQHCVRPAGVLCAPINVADSKKIFARIFSDYKSLSGSSNQQVLTFQSSATFYRIPAQQVLYIEAADKKLNIYTEKQCLTVYESLAALAELLSETFVRCHRSYLVNRTKVVSADFSESLLHLTDGSRVPIARSSRTIVRTLFDTQIEGDLHEID